MGAYQRDPMSFEIIYNYPPYKAVPDWTDGNPPDFSGATPEDLYVHIPFCAATCAYCHYTRKELRSASEADDYIELLRKEASLWLQACGGDPTKLAIKTVFVGGGTPTILSDEQIGKVNSVLTDTFGLGGLKEYTWEVSPETVVGEDGVAKLKALRSASVNRLSIGVQAFDERLLRICGRRHSRAQIFEAYQSARDAHFDNINLDLIYALPEQTYLDWKRTLDSAVEMHPQSISLHQLRLKPETPMYQRYAPRPSAIPGEVDRLRMLAMAHELLQEARYVPIECEIFVRDPLFRHHHQMNKWVDSHDHIGIGQAAYGYLSGTSYYNHLLSDKYRESVNAGRLPIGRAETLSVAARKARAFVLGLVFNDGLRKEWYETAFGETVDVVYGDLIKRLSEQGMIETADGRIKLTEKGRFYSPDVRKEFYLKEHLGSSTFPEQFAPGSP